MTSLSDRYEVLGLLATGGMASVLYGRLKGPAGFAREVAIKRLHPHFAREPEFLAMFVDEAHICARLSHANIVSALDVIDTPPDLCLVMEYIPGAGLDALLRASQLLGLPVPIPIATALLAGVLHGLHAAHEARDEDGSPLGIVHRDVSPSNVLVGQDGIARVLDFGIASAVSKVRSTPTGEIKGKFAYMAPELLRGRQIDRRLDVYAAAVVLWETLIGRSLFGRQPSASVVQDVLEGDVSAPSRERANISPALDAIVLRGLARDPAARFESAEAFAIALEQQCEVATQSDVSAWVRVLMGKSLDNRALELRRLAQERVASPEALPELTSAESTQKQSFVPTIVSALPARTSALPAPPAWVGQTGRWPMRVAATLLVCGALRADASNLRSRAEEPQASTTPPLRVIAPAQSESTPPSEPRAPAQQVAELRVQERGRPTRVSLEPRVVVSNVDRPVALSDEGTRAVRAAPRRTASQSANKLAPGKSRPLDTPVTDRPPRPATTSSKLASPAAPPVGASDDCRQAFELETIDGLVVKTFKPRCLH